MKRKDEAHRLYYIEQYPSALGEEIELYTGDDIEQVVEHNQLLHPENSYVIRVFEHT